MEGVHRDGDYQCDECDFAEVKREELNNHVEAAHSNGNDQCDECNFATVINKWMLKQFVVVIPNVLNVVNKNSVISQDGGTKQLCGGGS